MYRLFLIMVFMLVVSCGGGGGSSNSTEETGNVTVFKSTEAIQCDDSSGISLEQSTQSLFDFGIDVIPESSVCGMETNKSVSGACGSGTVDINIHDIREVNLVDAEFLGYADIAELEEKDVTGGVGYEVVADCLGR
ncbi:MAG: hypothetical protein ACJA04_000638 [Cellvibrionaceae bacterium]|jgi:hypothetical protein